MIKFIAPAKVNLSLEVLSKRHDGYHNIVTVAQTVNLCDEVILLPDNKDIKVVCQLYEIENNIIYRTAKMLQKYTKTPSGAKILLKKKIPLSAGLGGGSSDAAATLKGLMKLWHCKLVEDELLKLAINIGSDVPFFLYGGCCLVEGKGEKVTPLKTAWDTVPLKLVLVWPRKFISTKEVYTKVDTIFKKKKNTLHIGSNISKATLYKKLLFNRLEGISTEMCPEITKIKQVLNNIGIKRTLMTGSGPTVFGLIENSNQYNKICSIMKKYPWDFFIVKTLSRNSVLFT